MGEGVAGRSGRRGNKAGMDCLREDKKRKKINLKKE